MIEMVLIVGFFVIAVAFAVLAILIAGLHGQVASHDAEFCKLYVRVGELESRPDAAPAHDLKPLEARVTALEYAATDCECDLMAIGSGLRKIADDMKP